MLIAALLAALLLLPPPGRLALAMVVAALGALEWARLCALSGLAAGAYCAAVTLALLGAYFAGAGTPLYAVSALFWICAAPAWMWRGVAPAQAPLLYAAGFVVLVPAALALAELPGVQVVLVLTLVSLTDAGAYFVGSAWGRNKLAPSISPGKTREGALGGIAVALVYAIICGAFVEGIAWVTYLLSAALIAVLGIVGDLFESAVKRQAGAKDSGTLLPGHGGVLDRVDSATATLPLAALLIPWVTR